MLVAKRDLGIANARLMAGFVTVNQLAGPPVGALLFGPAGPAVPRPGASGALSVLLVLAHRGCPRTAATATDEPPTSAARSSRGCAGCGTTPPCARSC